MLRRQKSERPKEVADDRMGGQGREVGPEDHRQQRAVALDGRYNEASRRPQPAKENHNLRKGRTRN